MKVQLQIEEYRDVPTFVVAMKVLQIKEEKKHKKKGNIKKGRKICIVFFC